MPTTCSGQTEPRCCASEHSVPPAQRCYSPTATDAQQQALRPRRAQRRAEDIKDCFRRSLAAGRRGTDNSYGYRPLPIAKLALLLAMHTASTLAPMLRQRVAAVVTHERVTSWCLARRRYATLQVLLCDVVCPVDNVHVCHLASGIKKALAVSEGKGYHPSENHAALSLAENLSGRRSCSDQRPVFASLIALSIGIFSVHCETACLDTPAAAARADADPSCWMRSDFVMMQHSKADLTESATTDRE
jgi:hypothetical protein